jgi:hypothetical protein
MSRIYFTLAAREPDGVWAPQFGDYDRQCVAAELDDYAQHDYRRKDLKVVKSFDDQASINKAMAALNG